MRRLSAVASNRRLKAIATPSEEVCRRLAVRSLFHSAGRSFADLLCRPVSNFLRGLKQSSCALARAKPGLKVPATLQVKVMDLAIEPGQNCDELSIEQR
jgi:hypothetical protein